ncbi:MAG: L,D-transpeptidase [Clostridia bacterium]|nr:L,D-transpeptidase [Clostridia bacterium]
MRKLRKILQGKSFGRGAQALSFLLLSCVVLVAFARFYRVMPRDSSLPSTTRIAIGAASDLPKASANDKALSSVTITFPASPAGTSSLGTTSPTRPSLKPSFTSSTSKTTTSTSKTTTSTSKTTTSTSKTTTSTSKTTTSTSKTTTSTSKTTTSASKTTTSASNTTTSASKTTTTTKATEQGGSSPYFITVYKGSQSTVVYGKNSNGAYTRIVKIFTCSTGRSSSPTRIGTYHIRAKYRWRWLVGGVYGQWNSSISSSYLFHSVPYYKQDASTLENEEYDKLGTPASKGCIRMCVRDCKWIYDNCPIGTEVSIVNDSGPAGSGVPRRRTDEAYSGWDPSDQWSAGNPYYS